MAQGHQFRRALGGLDAGDARDGEHVALGHAAVAERGEDLVEGLPFDYRQKAGSADAAGGVRAAAVAAERLNGEILTWLGQARPGLCSPR